MARPREIDIDVATRQAMELFWRKGFVATSMSDIYAATGLKPGNLYATFGDKDGLFRAAFAAYAKHFEATLPLDVEGVGAIRAWLETQVQLATGDPDRKGCLIINTNLEREAHTLETQQLAAGRLNDIRVFFCAPCRGCGITRRDLGGSRNSRLSGRDSSGDHDDGPQRPAS